MLSGNSSKTFLDIDVVLSPFHTSNATLNGGSNNDTINLSSSTNAGIYLSTVTANSNEGNDIVNINANLSGINSSQVTLEGGKGDDSVSIVSQENSAIYSATVNIDGGNDDDNIIITGKMQGIGISSNVSINGGAGKDTISINKIYDSSVNIVAGAGDIISVGNGSANYNFDSTNSVIINNATFNSSSPNTSASLQTSENSIFIKSEWSGTVGISSGKTLTDIIDVSVDSEGVYCIIDGKLVFSDPQPAMSEEEEPPTLPSDTQPAAQSTTTINTSNYIRSVNSVYSYFGSGRRIISNYLIGEVVALQDMYTGIDLRENSFYVNSSSGSLEIQNARDKFIGYSVGSNTPLIYSYVASGSGEIDGRNKSEAEILIGATNSANNIYAGNGASSMWGGMGGNDILVGGSAYNEFFYGIGGGNDIILNAKDNDLVNLIGVSISQISGVDINIGQLNINFVDGGNLQINGSSGVAYRIAEGTFAVDQATGEWSVK